MFSISSCNLAQGVEGLVECFVAARNYVVSLGDNKVFIQKSLDCSLSKHCESQWECRLFLWNIIILGEGALNITFLFIFVC